MFVFLYYFKIGYNYQALFSVTFFMRQRGLLPKLFFFDTLKKIKHKGAQKWHSTNFRLK